MGRLGGIGVTAAYAALMAFLWMPPRHSLRVSETQDMLALAFYCAAGVALTRTAPGARKHARDGVGPVRFLQPSPTDLISDPIVHRISGARPVKTEAAFAAAFACSPDQTLEMLAEVLTEGMRPPETHVRPVIVDVRPAPPCRLSLPEHARSALIIGWIGSFKSRWRPANRRMRKVRRSEPNRRTARMTDYDHLRPEVDRFLSDYIDSVPHLEALLLLWHARPKPWSVEETAKRLFVEPAAAQSILTDLARKQFIARKLPGEHYTYLEESDRDRLIAAVDSIYRHELIRVSRLIHSKPSAAIRDFAAAFRIKKDQK